MEITIMLNKINNFNDINNKYKYIGVIGSGLYKRKDIVIKILNNFIKFKMIIVSGHSPRNKYNNVDIWAENWGNNNCNEKSIIYKTKFFHSYAFFERNKKIADKSNFLFIFINKGQYKSGAFNTLKYFLIKYKELSFERFIIFNENGNKWKYHEFPNWVKKYSNKNKKLKISKNITKY